jgi:hypothetical protein
MFTELNESLEQDRLAEEAIQEEAALQVEDTDIDQELGDVHLAEQMEEIDEISVGVDAEMPIKENKVVAEGTFFFAESSDVEDDIEQEIEDGTLTTGDGEDLEGTDKDVASVDGKKPSKKEVDNIDSELEKVGEEISQDGEDIE